MGSAITSSSFATPTPPDNSDRTPRSPKMDRPLISSPSKPGLSQSSTTQSSKHASTPSPLTQANPRERNSPLPKSPVTKLRKDFGKFCSHRSSSREASSTSHQHGGRSLSTYSRRRSRSISPLRPTRASRRREYNNNDNDYESSTGSSSSRLPAPAARVEKLDESHLTMNKRVVLANRRRAALMATEREHGIWTGPPPKIPPQHKKPRPAHFYDRKWQRPVSNWRGVGSALRLEQELKEQERRQCLGLVEKSNEDSHGSSEGLMQKSSQQSSPSALSVRPGDQMTRAVAKHGEGGDNKPERSMRPNLVKETNRRAAMGEQFLMSEALINEPGEKGYQHHEPTGKIQAPCTRPPCCKEQRDCSSTVKKARADARSKQTNEVLLPDNRPVAAQRLPLRKPNGLKPGGTSDLPTRAEARLPPDGSKESDLTKQQQDKLIAEVISSTETPDDEDCGKWKPSRVRELCHALEWRERLEQPSSIDCVYTPRAGNLIAMPERQPAEDKGFLDPTMLAIRGVEFGESDYGVQRFNYRYAPPDPHMKRSGNVLAAPIRPLHSREEALARLDFGFPRKDTCSTIDDAPVEARPPSRAQVPSGIAPTYPDCEFWKDWDEDDKRQAALPLAMLEKEAQAYKYSRAVTAPVAGEPENQTDARIQFISEDIAKSPDTRDARPAETLRRMQTYPPRPNLGEQA